MHSVPGRKMYHCNRQKRRKRILTKDYHDILRESKVVSDPFSTDWGGPVCWPKSIDIGKIFAFIIRKRDYGVDMSAGIKPQRLILTLKAVSLVTSNQSK